MPHNPNMGSIVPGLPDRVDVLGASVDPWAMKQTVQAVDWLIQNGRFAHLVGVNADKLIQMRNDPGLNDIVHRCEIINADGASMVIAAKKLGVAVPERVTGIDLMQELCTLAESKKYMVYLLGAKNNVVCRTAEVLKDRYPRMRIAGLHDGYFSDSEFDTVIAQVKKSRPDIIFVGITSPKKEYLIERFRELGAVGVFVGVGGSFDVISGNIPRAPMWMQRANLEWLFRMIQEPRRLIKRYIVGNARFYAILRAEMRMRRRRRQ